MLKSMLGKAAPDHAVEVVNTEQDLDAVLARASLLLVNRVLDGRFPSESGIELIERLNARERNTPPMILVSNLDDAQAQAARAGAMPGFGKSELYAPETIERVREAIGAKT